MNLHSLLRAGPFSCWLLGSALFWRTLAEPLAPTVSADLSLQKAIDASIEKEMAEQRIPGLSLAVVQSGKLVQAKGFGLASLELNVPATTDTLHGLGSVCKQFTAAAVMWLVERGKVGLDDRLSVHFDWVPKEWSEVTVRHLLTHTSGIRTEEWPGGILEFDRFEHDHLEVIKRSFGPLLTKPGEKFAYSNLGYRVLGMLIEKASGQSYWQFLDEHLFRPAGMEVTRNSDPKTVIPNRARGYGIAEDHWVNREPVTASSAFSQGALISSVLDLVKWDAALTGEKVLQKGTLEQMWTPVRLNDGTSHPYGFGWYVRPVPGHRTVAHGGGLPGFTSFIWRFLDDQLTVIILANCETADLGRISLGIAGLYVPELISAEIKRQL